ncbi:MAG: rhomboid family intramembrane serine protease [Lewinella sp.]|jgi:membrane associated rhomboid family serine protease|uniref:rhomboid family intramembrane serine protease n=1 Tax=Lewinella sp. TaxID=2004506 RepID=UPI003D6B6BF8
MSISLTLVLIILTCLISYQAFNNPEMKAKLLFRPVDIRNGEYYRFFTSGLIHGDFSHLLFNMWALYIFGELVENIFITYLFGPTIGRVAFLIFYFSAVAVASLPSYFRHQDNYAYSALGASGATSALSMIFIMFLPWEWFVFPPLPGILLAVGFLWYSSYMDKQGRDNIGHNAHLSGAIYGIGFIIVASLLLKPELLTYMLQQLLAGPQPFPGF